MVPKVHFQVRDIPFSTNKCISFACIIINAETRVVNLVVPKALDHNNYGGI